MAFGGLALKSVSLLLRAIEFCCAAIILGIFSYFLAELTHHGLHIDTYLRAVEGISGAGVLYTIFALLLVCFLGGIAFFSLLGMLLDLAFTGAFIYVAYATRHGDNSCSGFVQTPVGNGNTNTGNAIQAPDNGTLGVSLHTACRLNTACFAVAIVAAVFFFLSIFVEFGLIRHHKKEKAFGPSPNNGYTAGSPRRKFWQRKPKNRDAEFAAGALAAEKNPDHLPAHQTPLDVRNSYATESTAVGAQEPAYRHPVGTAVGGQQTGYTTQTTTHTPYATGANELPGQQTGTYQAYGNPGRTGNF